MNLDKALNNSGPANTFVLNPATNTYTPVNLIPSVLTKCLNCNLYYPISEIESHLRTHSRTPSMLRTRQSESAVINGIISQKNRMSSIEHIAIDQIANSNVLKMPDLQIDVRTMHPDEVPTVDMVRKPIQMPRPVKSNESAMTHSGEIMTNIVPDVMVHYDQEMLSTIHNENLNQEDHYFQELAIHQNVVNLQKKEISRYAFSNSDSKQQDSYVDSKRIQKYDTPSTVAPKYKIEKYIEPVTKATPKVITINDYNRLQTSQQSNFMHSGSRFHEMSAPSGYEHINRKERRFEEMVVNGCPDPRDCACPGCGGFYCPVCKSTVPPQYRLPPGYKIVKDEGDFEQITRKPTESQF